MSVTLNEQQLTSLARFNRSYAIKTLTLTEHAGSNDWITCMATLKAGKDTFDKYFVLSEEGKLVKDVADAEVLEQGRN